MSLGAFHQSVVMRARIKREKGMKTGNEQFEPHSEDVFVHVSAVYLDTSSNKDFPTFFLCLRGALCQHS